MPDAPEPAGEGPLATSTPAAFPVSSSTVSTAAPPPPSKLPAGEGEREREDLSEARDEPECEGERDRNKRGERGEAERGEAERGDRDLEGDPGSSCEPDLDFAEVSATAAAVTSTASHSPRGFTACEPDLDFCEVSAAVASATICEEDLDCGEIAASSAAAVTATAVAPAKASFDTDAREPDLEPGDVSPAAAAVVASASTCEPGLDRPVVSATGTASSATSWGVRSGSPPASKELNNSPCIFWSIWT
mmetsp:Transcript_68109/g.158046  ORF Transcript_68109/g.158046 Transcript_68109/m.158046 type:complete len:248 (+) Transcript_68109:440-1183(+)